jgi:carboxylate-amine ligase
MSANYPIGIEEEYFVVDARTRNVRRTMSKRFYRACKVRLQDHVTNEMLQSQIEVMSLPCSTVAEVHRQIAYFRSVVGGEAERFGLGIVAAGTHPLAMWREQQQTAKARYSEVMTDIQMLGLRNMLCGMHVHVELPDPTLRVEVMYRALPYLPLMLALSTSSPFWQGHRTGLLGYRLAAYDELPRTGLPELFKTAAEYAGYLETLIGAGVIKDSSFIWWAIRPSLRHPTLELRIADVCTRVEDAICIAAIYRCLVRHLYEHPTLNAGVDVIDRAICEENKWRAQRYGIGATFIGRRLKTAKSMESAVGELLSMLAGDAEALGCAPEIRHATEILKRGSSANEQIGVYAQARTAGRSRTEALRDVVDWLCGTTLESCNPNVPAFGSPPPPGQVGAETDAR